MNISFKHMANALLLIGLIFVSLSSRAESDGYPMIQFKISSLQLFSSFSSFIYFQGDERSRTRLLNAKNRGDQTIAALPEPAVELKLKWQEISEYVESYQSHNFDGVDMSLEGGWSILQRELNELIAGKEIAKATGISAIQIQMETILSQYMGYANSTTGGYGVSYGDAPLEDQIKSLQQELTTLANADSRYQPLVKKWSYIQATLLAYNSNVAPFVVLYTFDGMRKMIASE